MSRATPALKLRCGLRILTMLVCACLICLVGSDWGKTDMGTWLVMAHHPSTVNGQTIALRARATLLREIPAIGVYTIRGDSLAGRRLASDPTLQVARISHTDVAAADVANRGATRLLGRAATKLANQSLTLPFLDDDFYFAGQWALQAIHAPEAWATGQRGRGVRVAVLDTGIDPTHPDLVQNVNVALARSFVPGQTWDVSSDALQDFDHGTHVAGIIAAADNAFGIIGVAPEAEIVPVQVLRRPSGTGPPDAVIAGIIYAADIGADVINLSLAYTRSRHGGVNTLGTEDPTDDEPYSADEAAALAAAFARAAQYAHARGATIVTGTHNDATDADHDRDLFVLPRDAPHVITVAATGPQGWALNPGVDLDIPAFYTNFGQSVVDVSAPGGNIDFNLLASGAVCTVSSGPVVITLPCWFFDGVLSTAPVKGGFLYEFRRGTSMASAHASGVAALIVGAHGGSMDPQHVRTRLLSSADDLGKPGKDDFHGAGRINALSAVR
jgi:lantibiotic leader peptide-processing serine protease